ncbi:IclR family transcriptional regulator [Halobacterium sp. R2-5]|uniref:IclR family transcriptional regulator n=1 Tax=Halobacterium sp. R2-5 TaxID=2715751 RepID=UPI001420D45A|nr:IclR family transcriptional regulator [Halobacterium sp. R2-5]NIC01019.1 IclR family transcriptional regulator [Halobacterium sp. R2-5]
MDELSRSVQSVETMFNIVELLVERDGAGVTEISQELNLAKSTVHQQLSTLRSLGYAVMEEDKYYPGLRFLSIGEYTRNRREVTQKAGPMVEQLAKETEERAQFFVEEHKQGVYLHISEGERAVQADRHPGKLRYLHSSAGGKAILAFMDRDRVQEVIDRWGLPAETEHTITDEDELYAELDRITERGYATNKEESIDGLWSLGVPVIANGQVVGSFSVSGPRHRLDTEWFREELPNLLRGTANELELKLEYS